MPNKDHRIQFLVKLAAVAAVAAAAAAGAAGLTNSQTEPRNGGSHTCGYWHNCKQTDQVRKSISHPQQQYALKL